MPLIGIGGCVSSRTLVATSGCNVDAFRVGSQATGAWRHAIALKMLASLVVVADVSVSDTAKDREGRGERTTRHCSYAPLVGHTQARQAAGTEAAGCWDCELWDPWD
jgi:hypothetical protein